MGFRTQKMVKSTFIQQLISSTNH